MDRGLSLTEEYLDVVPTYGLSSRRFFIFSLSDRSSDGEKVNWLAVAASGTCNDPFPPVSLRLESNSTCSSSSSS